MAVLWLVMTGVAGCVLHNLLPGKATLTQAELAEFETAQPSRANYSGARRVPFPVIPVQVFGFYYDLDIVLVSKHPDWEMHEYARIQTPDGPFWMAKDTNRQGVQAIIADVEGIESLVAEVPVPRQKGTISVTDRSEGNQIDLDIAYTNIAGEAVSVTAQGEIPAKPPRKRSGNTMGHSQQAVGAVLDLERMGELKSARMEINGVNQRIYRVLGLAPMRYLLRQAQAGLAVTSYRQQPAENGFVLQRPANARETDPVSGEPGWPTQQTENWQVDDSGVHHTGDITSFHHQMVLGGLHHTRVTQHGRDIPIADFWLDPALPDLSRPFDGTEVSRFRIDVNGQKGHCTGQITARWTKPNTVVVDITPTAPHWLADRPMQTTISFEPDGSAVVQTVRTEAE